MVRLTCLQLKTLWEINKKPRCGYELMKKVNGQKVTQGTMYPLLQKLERIGAIKRAEGDCGKEPCKCKKNYQITKKGKEMLRENTKELCKTYEEIFQSCVCSRCKK